MSTKLGVIEAQHAGEFPEIQVWASHGGVELPSFSERFVLHPDRARALAALLRLGAALTERMRGFSSRDTPVSEPATREECRGVVSAIEPRGVRERVVGAMRVSGVSEVELLRVAVFLACLFEVEKHSTSGELAQGVAWCLEALNPELR